MTFKLHFPAGIDDPMKLDFAMWAPLGVDETLRELWRATPKATGIDDGYDPLPPPDASARLGQIAIPALFLVARHDPESFTQAARSAAERIPHARVVDVDSDHYLTIREPEKVAEVLLDFFSEVSLDGAR